MSRDITGLGPVGAGRPRSAQETGPAGPVAAARALVRVDGVAVPPAPSGAPLERSGLDLLAVLDGGDSLVTRTTAAPVATELGLEQARGALVRQQPGDALAALDAIWEGARHTEEGWYLRSGALLVLGLPGEGERVAQDGIDVRPASNALRFMQSLARLAVGDLTGARASLQGAMQRLPSDPLLLVQQAVLQATQGDSAGAESSLQAAQRRVAADHPAIVFGREAVRAATRTLSADRARQGARAATATTFATSSATSSVTSEIPPSIEAFEEAPAERRAATRESVSSDIVASESLVADALDTGVAIDPVVDAMRRLGARIGTCDTPSLARELRLLVRALSTGGALGSTGRPEQAHAARTLLGVLASVVSGDPCDAPPARRALVSAVLHALRSGHPEDVQRAMRRAAPAAHDSFNALLRSLIDGALGSGVSTRTAARGAPRAPHYAPVEATDPHAGDLFAGVVVPDLDLGDTRGDDGHSSPRAGPKVETAQIHEEARGVIVPVRLGLRLIDETPATRAATQRRVDVAGMRDTERLHEGVEFHTRAGPSASSLWAGPHGLSVDGAGLGWGAAAAAASTAPGLSPGRFGVSGHTQDLAAVGEGGAIGGDVRVAAVVCIAIAVIAGSVGWTSVAVAFGIGAAWLAMRRSVTPVRKRHHDDERPLAGVVVRDVQPGRASGDPQAVADEASERR